jgi:hydrogenase expression/formation protein HypC
MCLAIPSKVIELGEGDMATVALEGVKKRISVALLDEVAIGDYVLVHVGYALHKLCPEEAARPLAGESGCPGGTQCATSADRRQPGRSAAIAPRYLSPGTNLQRPDGTGM